MPLVGGQTFATPKIPELAEGGKVSTGGVAIVGERGPELVSLPAQSAVTPNASMRGAGVQKRASAPGAAGGPTTVILQLNEREFARAVIKVMDKKLNLSTGN